MPTRTWPEVVAPFGKKISSRSSAASFSASIFFMPPRVALIDPVTSIIIATSRFLPVVPASLEAVIGMRLTPSSMVTPAGTLDSAVTETIAPLTLTLTTGLPPNESTLLLARKFLAMSVLSPAVEETAAAAAVAAASTAACSLLCACSARPMSTAAPMAPIMTTPIRPNVMATLPSFSSLNRFRKDASLLLITCSQVREISHCSQRRSWR